MKHALRGTSTVHEASFASPLLSRFWNRAVEMRADVLVPDSYASSPERRYPAIYVVPAFGSWYRFDRGAAEAWRAAMQKQRAEFIVVSLDPSFPAGHNAFADSANDGPWASALVREFIPYLERQFRIDATPRTRFLNGQSSGGWSALWLQVNYPSFFGGAWASAPDPVDFSDFLGPDLTRVPAGNFYRDARGREYQFFRKDGRDTESLREYVRAQDASGPGNQIDSFDRVFSERGKDGHATRLFDHRTGAIDDLVARYWEAHYDIARLVRERWPALAPQLRGKVHIVVGTVDTYHLDEPVRRLNGELRSLGSDAQIVLAPGYDHFNIGRWDGGMLVHVVGEMKASLLSP